jgi:hypothetical protein
VQIAVFWVVAQCSLVDVTDVSEVLAASIIRAMISYFKASWLDELFPELLISLDFGRFSYKAK